jgi:ectoine hydroxylase-related dioxygenase (phytanoyl-CoA dioxygenase family)
MIVWNYVWCLIIFQHSHAFRVPTAWRRDDTNLYYGLYEVQEEMLAKRGALEESLMAGKGKPLEANKPRGVGSSGGFGLSKSEAKASFLQEAKAHASVLDIEGVVRIDGVISNRITDEMRKFVFELRDTALEEVSSGKVQPSDRFASVLLKSNRCDLTIPIEPPIVKQALRHILEKSSVKQTIEELLTSDAVLYELSCLISDSGSPRQNIHPDNPFLVNQPNEPTLLTCFIALQDIDFSMGPTVWIPKTHNLKSHERFQDETLGHNGEESPKDSLLRNSLHVLGTLKKGCCAIYDSRVLHCGSANRHESLSRALLYFSFKNPKIGYPGNPASIRRNLGEANIDLDQLLQELKISSKGSMGSAFLNSLSSKPTSYNVT